MLSFAVRTTIKPNQEADSSLLPTTHRQTHKSKGKLTSTLAGCVLLLATTACSQTANQSIQVISEQAEAAVKVQNASYATIAANTSTLRIGYVGTTQPTGPLGWAKHKGLLERELKKLGYEQVTFTRFPNGPNLNEALVAGQLDVGFLGDTPAIVLKATGFNTRLIRITQFDVTAWLVTKKNGARSVSDLKGKIVATQKGSYMHRYLLGLLNKTKLTKETKVVHLLSTEAQSALERGDIAGYAASSDLGVFLKTQGFPVIDSSAQHQGLSGTSLIVATEGLLKRQPDFPKRFNQIITTAVKDLKANSQNYYKYHADLARYPVDVIKVSYPLKQVSEEPFPATGLKLLEGTKKFLVSENLAKSDFKLADWIAK